MLTKVEIAYGETNYFAATMPEKTTEMFGLLSSHLKSVHAETYADCAR